MNTENTQVTETPAVQAPASRPAPRKRRPAKKDRKASKVRAKNPRKAAKAAKTNKGQKFSFGKIRLPRGTRLHSTFDPRVVVTVASDKTIRFKGKEMTLSAAAMILARRKGKKWPTIQGPLYFTYKGEKLTDLVH